MLGDFQVTPRYTRGSAKVFGRSQSDLCVLDHARLDDRTLACEVIGTDSFTPYEIELSDAGASVFP